MVMVLTAVDTEAPVLLSSIDNWQTVKTILNVQPGYLNKNIRAESPYMEYNNRLLIKYDLTNRQCSISHLYATTMRRSKSILRSWQANGLSSTRCWS